MSSVLFTVNVPVVSVLRPTMAAKKSTTGNVVAPRTFSSTSAVGSVVEVSGFLGSTARLSVSKPSEGEDAQEETESMPPPRKEVHCAKLVRDFLNHSKAFVDFISEISYLLGPVKWTVFHFSCKTTFAEECLRRLSTLGIGVRGKGAGIITVTPLHMQRVASHPKPAPPEQQIQLNRAASYDSSDSSSESDNEEPRIPDGEEKPLPPTEIVQAIGDASSTTLNDTISAGTGPTIGSFTRAEDLKSLQSEVISPENVEIGAKTSAKSIESSEADEKSPEAGKDSGDDADESIADSVHIEDEDLHVKIDEEKNRVEAYQSNFMQSIKSRIAVDNVVDIVTASAQFSFDYMMLVIVASVLSCIGLVTNNVVIIVASMLVSPLMGPILGVTFGWTMSDYKLMRTGLISELAGLGICCIVGFIGGLITVPLIGNELPTKEMWDRALAPAVFIGISIAIPSGVGVALSVLGNNTSSLVGVAISASLLPPAVNTGILFAMAALHGSTHMDLGASSEALGLGYEISLQLLVRGAGYSFFLTLANIIVSLHLSNRTVRDPLLTVYCPGCPCCHLITFRSPHHFTVYLDFGHSYVQAQGSGSNRQQVRILDNSRIQPAVVQQPQGRGGRRG
mmetsp:Transcript_20226/g.35970  ORF Transcript_20226/g.35970 Transcript_20226/m.35970 type:complete len:621 (+) Transcript_20226:349-2211(+)